RIRRFRPRLWRHTCRRYFRYRQTVHQEGKKEERRGKSVMYHRATLTHPSRTRYYITSAGDPAIPRHDATVLVKCKRPSILASTLAPGRRTPAPGVPVEIISPG